MKVLTYIRKFILIEILLSWLYRSLRNERSWGIKKRPYLYLILAPYSSLLRVVTDLLYHHFLAHELSPSILVSGGV